MNWIWQKIRQITGKEQKDQHGCFKHNQSNRSSLHLQMLEDRIQPAVNIVFNYSLDTSGFFADPTHQTVLQEAANAIASQLNNNLSAITPSGSNTWTPEIYNPDTGGLQQLASMNVAADTLIIYVGARALGSSEGGLGATGGEANVTGSSAWISTVTTRGQGVTTGSNATGFGPWGGSIAFDTTTNWYFGTSAAGIASNQVSFFTVAEHELGHVLGIGTAPSFSDKIVNGAFTGATAESVYGGPVPVSPDQAHWAESVNLGGLQPVMTPVLTTGTFLTFSALDYAGLADLGWQVGASTGGTPTSNPASQNPTATGTSGTAIPGLTNPLAGNTGSVVGTQIYATGTAPGNAPIVNVYNMDGTLRFSFYAYSPQFLVGVRVAVGDVLGTGYDDIITAPGPGGGPQINIYDGMTGQLVRSFWAYSPTFTGGVTVAVGDTNGSGHDNIITGAGTGGGPQVEVFDGVTNRLLQSFYAYEPTFTGGVNVAAGDITGSGHASIITGTILGAPHVEAFDGESLSLLSSFYAYSPTFLGGVNVAVGDFNLNGIGDIITAPGSGMAPLIEMFNVQQQLVNSFYFGSTSITTGENIATIPKGSNGHPELLITYSKGLAPVVFGFDLTNMQMTRQFLAYSSFYTGGVTLG